MNTKISMTVMWAALILMGFMAFICLTNGCATNTDQVSQMTEDLTASTTSVPTDIGSIYFNALKTTSPHSSLHFTYPLDEEQKAILKWMEYYLPRHDLFTKPELLPEKIIVALRIMNLKGTLDPDGFTNTTFYNRVLANPKIPIWASCGTESDFLIKVFAKFNIPTHGVALWSGTSDGHSLLEYYSFIFGKFVYYDQTYGLYLVDPQGVPGNMNDIQNEIAYNGFNLNKWELQPVRFTELFSNKPYTAIDPVFNFYNVTNYNIIVQNYFHVAALRYLDTTSWGTFLSGKESLGIRGKWVLYDNLVYTNLTDDEKRLFVKTLINAYSVKNKGRYYLTIQKLINEDLY